jgi:TonB-linked SusC/RagA family outer membrane protein
VPQWQALGRDEEGNLILNQTVIGQESLGFGQTQSGRIITYLEASVTYDRLFAARHRVGGLLMYHQRETNLSGLGSAYVQRSLPFRAMGFAGRVTYGFDDRFFAEFNVGYNGSENFARGQRFGFFPAGAVGWMVSNEEFWQPMLHVVDILRFRTSYGLVGNDNIGGQRRFVFQETITTDAGNRWQFGEAGQNNPVRIRTEHPANPFVTWETARKFNVGTEISLFRSLRMEIDYFHEHREGIFLLRQGLPALVGLTTQPWVNVGKMQNQGFDASMQFNRRVGSVDLSAMGNFTYTQNRVLDNDQPDWNYLHRNRIGKPWGQRFGMIAIGLFECYDQIANSPQQGFGVVRPGDLQFLDITGDGLVDENDEVAIGFPTDLPGIVYGFGLSARWRGFDASVFFQGVSRISIFIEGDSFRPFQHDAMGRSAINEDVYLRRWTEANPDPNARYPRLSIGQNPNNFRISTWNMHDGSFIRLKNAEIGFTFPQRIIEPLHMSNLRIFASGLNLLMFSSFDLWDPERGAAGNRYPPTRTAVAGISMSF